MNEERPRDSRRGVLDAWLSPAELEQVAQELCEVGDVDGAKTGGRTVAVASLVEPVVAAADNVKRRVRALVSLTGKGQSIEGIVKETQARAVQRLAQQRGNAVELRCDEAGTAAERQHFEAVLIRSVNENISGFRISVVRHVGKIATREVGGQFGSNWLRGRHAGIVYTSQHPCLSGLRALHTVEEDLIERY